MKAFLRVIIGTVSNEGVYGRCADKHASVFETSTTTGVPDREGERLWVRSGLAEKSTSENVAAGWGADRHVASSGEGGGQSAVSAGQ